MPAEVARPNGQEAILAAGLATLGEHDVPPDDEWLPWPDPDAGRPLELTGLADWELTDVTDATGDLVTEALPAGFLPRGGSGAGTGFADGGPLDVAEPGLALAGFADDAHGRLAELSDDELIGVLRAWRRQASWAQARELAAVAELARRRPAGRDRTGSPSSGQRDHPGKSAPSRPGGSGPAGRAPCASTRGFPPVLSEFVGDEIAAALTLTRASAEIELDHALTLAQRLSGTAAALEAGRIDLARAKVIITGTSTLTGGHAAAVEAAVLPSAPRLTTGQLRAAVARAVLTVDPQAARTQRREAEKHVRVECWIDPDGTASLAGRCLPAAETLAADKRICRIAKAWKKHGAVGGMDLLRARAYLALLLGQDVTSPSASLLPDASPAPARDHAAPGAGSSPGGSSPGESSPGGSSPGAGLPPLAGSINITLPFSTLLGLSDAPGEAPGYGPLDPDTARALACAAAGCRATRWHLTITGPGGQAVAHGQAAARETSTAQTSTVQTSTVQTSTAQLGTAQTSTAQPGTSETSTAQTSTVQTGGGLGHGGSGWTITVTAEPIASGSCDHRNREQGYRPSPALQRLVRARSRTCAAPGCRRPAAQCDLDHTIPHDHDGWTCEGNLAPLCRHHHRVKQAEGWKLQQASPGVMIWTTPARRRYTTMPSKHPT